MSPYDIEISASEARSKFAFLFGSIAELYRFHYGKKPSTKFEDIKTAVAKLNEDEKLSDYLKESLEQVFNKYPTLIPNVLAVNFKKDAEKTKDNINKLGQLVDILIGDVCGEINDLVEAKDEFEKESLNNWLRNQ